MNRKKVALLYTLEQKRGAPAPCFTPDFTQDNKLYAEVGGLNEISVAMSRHSLADICSMRLQEISSPVSHSGCSDGVLFDNIMPKSMTVNELMSYARSLEKEWKDSKHE